VDYVHCNALELDFDRNLLISSRNLDEVTKIDRNTGEVLWRMGGTQNEFTLVGDTQWYWRQHAVRRTASGTITLFDNGNYHVPSESRAVEYAVDEAAKVARLIWEYRHTPARYAPFTGNVQRLPTGNTLISWGNLGIVTEVRRDGTKAFEMRFAQDGVRTYRTRLTPWYGIAAAPQLWAEASASSVTLHFVKFGDTNVSQYHVYAGALPEPTDRVGSTPQNLYLLEGVASGETWYVRVSAEDGEGLESPYSNELEITIPQPTVPAPVATVVAGDLVLRQNRPNPFAGATSISFALAEESIVDVAVYTVSGRLVRRLERKVMPAGAGEVVWDGTDRAGRPVSSGVYLYRLETGRGARAKTMTVVR
jgi:hypothetical protein